MKKQFLLLAVLALFIFACDSPNGGAAYSVGDTGPAGGIVFYDKGNSSGGWRYLEAALSDLPIAQWASPSVNVPTVDYSLGGGKVNTVAIVAALDAASQTGRAAQLCADYVFGGMDDWYLPNMQELAQMYTQRVAIGGFAAAYYWSSNQNATTQTNAQCRDFSADNWNPYPKSSYYSVRPIRQFK